MRQALIAQQGVGEPTTPTPYPDGLIIHHADGTITYSDAYTGERVVQWGDEWYHSLGFASAPDLDWAWYGFSLFEHRLFDELLLISFWLMLLSWLALPLLPGLNPRRYRAYLGWTGCITIAMAAITLLTADNDWESIELSFPVIPAGLLFWWTSCAATSWRARTARVGVAAALLLFPWLPLALLGSTWFREEAIWGAVCFAAMLPLALSQRTDLMHGKQGWLVASVPILFFLTNLVGVSNGGGPFSPWASHAIPMAIAAFLLLRPRATLARPAVA